MNLGAPFVHKTAIVTGGANGIGLAICQRLCGEGARVLMLDRDRSASPAALQSVRESARHDGQISFLQVDMSKEAEVKAAFEASFPGRAPLHLLINNAARFVFGEVTDVTEQQWDQALNANVKGTLAAGAIMQKTRCAALDSAKWGVRVNAVRPGPILTEGTARHAKMLGVTLDEACEQMTSKQILPRMGTCEEVAAAVAFLASDESAFPTGTSLILDGGYTAL